MLRASSSSGSEISSPIDFEGCLRDSLEFPIGCQGNDVYDVECGMAMEPMKWKWSSFRVDLGYTEPFCDPEVISLFFSSCDSVLDDSVVFQQANRGSLHVRLGTQNCSARNAGESVLISQRGEIS